MPVSSSRTKLSGTPREASLNGRAVLLVNALGDPTDNTARLVRVV